MKSMTGCSIKEYEFELGKFTIEIRAVNSKYMDLAFKVSKDFFKYEDELRRLFCEKIKRGRISIFIKFDSSNKVLYNIEPDYNLAFAYLEAYDKLKNKLNLKEKLEKNFVLEKYLDDIFKKDDNLKNIDVIGEKLKQCFKESINDFDSLRLNEGNFIKKIMKENIDNVITIIDKIEKISPCLITSYKDKLKEKIFKLFEDISVDKDRLLMEAGFYAERHDITEEIVRLRSHINLFIKDMNKKESLGKKMDFIVQEINREINTIGSKVNDFSIAELIIDAKNEMEKIREQIQNME